MIRAIALGLSAGICTALFNYLMFVRIYPPGKFLKQGAASRMMLFYACLFLEIIFLGIVYRHCRSLPGMGEGSVSGNLCLLSMVIVFFLGLIWFYAVPIIKARKKM